MGGPGTISQSLKAVRVDGCISIIGFVAGKPGEAVPNFLEVLGRGAVVRGVHVGSRILMDDMGRAIDAAGIKPIIDGRVFQLHEARDAYQYLVSLPFSFTGAVRFAFTQALLFFLTAFVSSLPSLVWRVDGLWIDSSLN